ncbi:polysaccharide deacetylase family protein [Clostridium swellfunianum]|uniref:XrtA system polysaccharide deacetylase n=1 Tax=Clostridium swellfunianum TaxID=1367462 RepID=UPI00202EDAB7|nr:XrtA system polysaccharide deacetylase [Clostridium swellfunianum]MCM0647212.1 polysaccharide deacetylase family protein [Clostridium swellfunianum]
MKNVFTIDVEDWFHTMDFNFPVSSWNNYEDRVHHGLKDILELLDKYNVKATFFVLGYVARKHPELVRELINKGHEIGSHGDMHKMVTTQNREEFKKDVAASKEILEDMTGKKINIYRSSSWSIVPKTMWALEVLEELGFKYDSSIQPFTTPLSGFRNAPRTPFYPVVNGKRLNLLEFPPSVMPLGKACLPFCGGLYLRVLPKSFINYALNKVNKNNSGMIYTHPWELDVKQPRLKVPPHIKFTHYYNLSSTKDKLEYLLQNFEFDTLSKVVEDGVYPYIELK